MTRPINKLSDVAVKATAKPGRRSDGGGLYLSVGPTGGKSWTFVWTRDGKKREMGLGAYPAVSLSKARQIASDCRVVVAEGGDPIAERNKDAEPTFAEATRLFLADNKAGWRNDKHKAQWDMTLGDAYCSHLQPMQVSAIGTEDVLKVLKPIWLSKAETASRLRGRIERVLSFAKVKGWRSGENPAAWRGHLDALLPKRQKLQRGHHAAMPYSDVPGFVERLRGAEALAARALEFLILTAGRSGEVLGTTWDEIDFEQAVWTVPAVRMKAGKEHRVPLSKPALAIVEGAPRGSHLRLCLSRSGQGQAAFQHGVCQAARAHEGRSIHPARLQK